LAGRTTARFVDGAIPQVTAPPGSTHVPMAAAWAGRLPVAFCYPVWQTERWWDVSIDTLETHRRQGYAQRAARALVRHLRSAGRAPVWGALEGNPASRALAARLGFIELGGMAVFARGK
jgi:RimJ/RimL family protein N-acetyltransferase